MKCAQLIYGSNITKLCIVLKSLRMSEIQRNKNGAKTAVYLTIAALSILINKFRNKLESSEKLKV